MADYEACNGVTASNLEACNGVAKANIETINGLTVPASGATRAFIGLADARVGLVPIADVADVTVWEDNTYQGRPGDTWDLTDIAYGKDGSGNPHYAAVINGNNPEIIYASETDFIAKNNWSENNLTLRQRTILWGNNVWVSAGLLGSSSANQHIYRSTNGSTWSQVDISGLGNVSTLYANGIYALTSDGNGTWFMALKDEIYKSTDDAASWSLEHTVSTVNDRIWDLVITNNTLVCLYQSGGPKLISAALSDTTDWSSATTVAGTGGLALGSTAKRMAGGNGRVVVIDTGKSVGFDVNGKTITAATTRQVFPDEGNANCIATDGQGNWYVGSDGGTTGADGGDICESTDNGASWTRIVHGITASAYKIEGIGLNVYLPL